MIDLLCLLLPAALRAIKNPGESLIDDGAAVLADILDLIIARTTFKWMVDRGPRNGEKTISDMLENLTMQEDHPDRQLFVQIALKINRIAGYAHIKSVA